MGSRTIFFTRLLKGWKYQYRIYQSIADWTVMLYIFLPTTIIFLFIYRSWWVETPIWIENMPFFLLFFLVYLLSWNGNIHTFVEEADKVFLIKKLNVFFGVKKWGYFYSLFFQSTATVALIQILLPFLRNYYLLEWQQIIALVFYFIGLKTFVMWTKYHLNKIEKRVKKIAFRILAFIALCWFSQFIYFVWEKEVLLPVYICGVILTVFSIKDSLRTLRKIGTIDYEIDRGQGEKTKNIQLIFMLSPEIEKHVVLKRTRPLFFRHSEQLFKIPTPTNAFIELFAKVFLRNFSYVGGFF